MTTTLTAWRNDPALKAEVAERMRAHRAADEIVQGLYQLVDPELASGYKGCLIGCTLPAQPFHGFVPPGERGAEPPAPDAGWHRRVEELYGIPAPLGHLMDRVFEGLPTDEGAHTEFAVASIEAIPVGADLSMVSSRLMLDFLADPEQGVRQYTVEGSVQRAAVEAVAALYARRLAGDEPSEADWRAAADAAAHAAYAAAHAAYAAAHAAHAADAAAHAAYAAAHAAHAAAHAAYAADAAYAAYAAWWAWAAQRLLHHLAVAPIPALTSTT